jgi:hypothetical protein
LANESSGPQSNL